MYLIVASIFRISFELMPHAARGLIKFLPLEEALFSELWEPKRRVMRKLRISFICGPFKTKINELSLWITSIK